MVGYLKNSLMPLTDHHYQRWSPRGRPWPRGRPRGHILKSLAQVLFFFFGEHLRFVSLDLFFFFFFLGLGLEHSCPWPRECLSSERLSLALASDFFCVLGLGLEPCVLDSTSDHYYVVDKIALLFGISNHGSYNHMYVL